MTLIGIKLQELKCALQELETAVQEPRDEQHSIKQVLYCFPKVLTQLYGVILDVLATHNVNIENPRLAFTEAHQRGWLKGELSLWLRLITDYQQLQQADAESTAARSVAQDVRACTCILWETYELLTDKFRWQTQTQLLAKARGPNNGAVVQWVAPQI